MTLFLAALIGTVLAAAGVRMHRRGPARPLRRRSVACLTAALPVVGLLLPVVVGVAVNPPSAGANPPSVVTDVNPDSMASGTLFGGRVEAFSVDPANTNLVFAATEDGGLWKSTDHGSTWSHVDAVLLTAMQDVQFAASDPNLVIATGASDGSTGNVGGGIWRSTDGGTTWAKAPHSDLCNPDSASKIAIAPGTPGSLTIFVGTLCGLDESTNSGSSWSLVEPSGSLGIDWDVQVRTLGSALQVDTCGTQGFFRSNDGGATWPVQNTSWLANTNNNSVPCRIAVAPGDANTIFLTSGDKTVGSNNIVGTQLLENDNGGVGSFHNLNVSNDGNGRPPFVITLPAFSGTPNNFEVIYGTDSIVMHQTCSLTTTPRCGDGTDVVTETGPAGISSGPWSPYDGSIRLLHNSTDPGTLAIDPTTGCPFLEGGDPGIFKTSNGCTSSPTFTNANSGEHALEIYSLAGTAASGHTDLYYGMQDNGLWASTDGGTTWCDCVNADVPQVLADRTGPPSSVFFNQDGGLNLANEAVTSGVAFTPPPPVRTPPPPCPCGNAGTGPAAQFGYQSYAVVTSNGLTPPAYTVWVTTNAGTAWTQMGPATLPGPPTGSFPIEAAGPSATPTFYLDLSVSGTPTLYSLTGALNSTATLTPLNGGLGNAGAFNVDPANPLELYAVDNSGSGAVKFSTNGGTSWQTDTALTSLVTDGGVFPFNEDITAFAFDPNSNTILAGTNFTGIFASTDGGAHWFPVPGSQQISRVSSFFFDGNNPGRSYVGSYGRGIWRIDLPTATPTGLTTMLSNASVNYGTGVTDQASLSGTNSANADGTVTYTVYSDSSCTVPVAGEGTVTVSNGSVPVSKTFTASGAGTYYWQASYSGDDINLPSTSTCTSEKETVHLLLAPTTLPDPTWETPYTPTPITATGGTGNYTFSLLSGSLPVGMSITTSADAGVFSGVATDKAQIGNVFTFTVEATDTVTGDTGTQQYSFTLRSPCATGLTPYFLTASSRTGNFTGFFCVNGSGTGTYRQVGGPTGTGTVITSGGTTRITGFGTNLALLGEENGSFSTFRETAPSPAKAGTFTLV
ncbi:MAG TPA: hypothetical protein VN796_09825 [Acidimicrobiales bacterium]|nr:hypothetical protein [Acidimicrobiales bacterium]